MCLLLSSVRGRDGPQFVSPTGGHLSPFQYFRWTSEHRFLYDSKSLFCWDKYSGVTLLGHMVNECLALKETAELFSRVAVPFCIPTSDVTMI